MAIYNTNIKRIAEKEIRALSRVDMAHIVKKIMALSENPRPHGVQKLVGEKDAYRIRHGSYRIVYLIDDTEKIVRILYVGHRREVYRGL